MTPSTRCSAVIWPWPSATASSWAVCSARRARSLNLSNRSATDSDSMTESSGQAFSTSDWQDNRERTALARLRVEHQLAAVIGDDIATDRQAQPGAFGLAGQRVADLLKFLEHALLIGRGNAHTRI